MLPAPTTAWTFKFESLPKKKLFFSVSHYRQRGKNWFFPLTRSFSCIFCRWPSENEEHRNFSYNSHFSNSLISSLKPISVLRDWQTSIYFATLLSRLPTSFFRAFLLLFSLFRGKIKNSGKFCFGNVKDKVFIRLWFKLIKSAVDWPQKCFFVNCEKI